MTSTNGGAGNTATATLNVFTAPSFSKAFGVSTVALNGTTNLSFTVTSNSSSLALNGVSFTDALPSGLVVASSPNLTSSCGSGGTISAAAGAASISLASAQLASSAVCTISVDVTAASAGVKDNSVQLSTWELGSGATATASLTVIAPPSITKSFTPDTSNQNYSALLVGEVDGSWTAPGSTPP